MHRVMCSAKRPCHATYRNDAIPEIPSQEGIPMEVFRSAMNLKYGEGLSAMNARYGVWALGGMGDELGHEFNRI